MPPDDRELRAAIDVLRRADVRRVQRLGWHFVRNDYYCPLDDLDCLDANRTVWAERFLPLAIDWNVAGQLAVAREVGAFAEELREIPEQQREAGTFFWQNDAFNRADPLVLYGLARARQPARWIEIGCGYSSLVLAQALAKNARPCAVTLIEPYPDEAIFARLPPSWRRGRHMLQHVELETFDELAAGDVLFYDGSHCAKTGSDVNYFFFKLLPRLQPGVLVHVHDIFLPDPYPEEWTFERHHSWNEQFVLQAFLMHNTAWRVTIANQYLFAYHRAEVEACYRGVQGAYGCSFWMTRV